MPLLLLATPQRATLHDLGHHAGASDGRASASSTSLSTSWTIPARFALLADSSTRRQVSVTSDRSRVSSASPQTHVENVSFRQVPPTTTTTAPPPPPAPQAQPAVAPSSVAATPKPVSTPAPAPPSDSVSGLASWYGSPAGTCASPSLAFGTVVTVTDLATGVSVRCTVDDREAHNPGRVIDLSPATFSQLASLEVGVIEVHLSW